MVRIGIRCDAGEEHGFGHIARMNTLCAALKMQTGTPVDLTFHSKTPTLWMSQLAPTYADVIRHDSSESEMHIMIDMADGHEYDIIIIDHKDPYDIPMLKRIKEHTKLVLIDMPWARPEECDLLVIPNFHQPIDVVEQLDHLFDEDSFLYGKDYVLLREQVLAEQWLPYSQRQQQIAFFAGGSDTENLLELMYNMTEKLSQTLPNVQRLFCIGEAARSLQVAPGDHNVYITGYHLSHLQKCALAVSLFGVTPYEAIYLRTPVITFGHNKSNDVASEALALASEGATIHMPEATNRMREDFCRFVAGVWLNLDLRHNMYQASVGLIPNTGAQNIATRILEL